MASKHNFLYLIWKNPNTRRNYIVGKLTRDEGYKFEYCEEYKEAMDSGWNKLEAFPEEREYRSTELFTAFACRLPDKKRRGIETILEKYGLKEYDGYELLRKSAGRLPIDTYEFISPIFADDEIVEREIYVAGIKHMKGGCNGIDCAERPNVECGDLLDLVPEPTNKYDDHAVKVMTKKGAQLGYIPRYYSESVANRLARSITYLCTVKETTENADCGNCIKVLLQMPRIS